MPSLRRSWMLGFQEVIFKRDLQDGETAHPFFLGSNILQDPFARRALAELYQALKGTAPGDLTSPEKAQLVLRTIQQAIASGELISARRQGVAGGSSQVGGNSSGQNAAPPPKRRSTTPPPPRSKDDEKTWVEVRLIDQNGKPVPGAKYKLKITDGSVREGSLDSDGRVRVNGIDPGNCTVWFPDYDGKEWKPA